MRIGARDIALTLLSGVLLALAFSSYNLGGFAWVAFLPSFIILMDKRGVTPFFLGLIWGIAFFSGALYWISYAAAVYGNLSWILSIIITLLLSSVLSLYMALFFQGASYLLRRGGLYLLFGLPSLWVSLELLRARLFTGFPWASLGYSQHLFIPLIQIADITGIYGISFLIMMVNTLFLIWFQRLRERRVPFKETFIVIFFLGLSLIYGLYREIEVKREMEDWKSLKVGIVQGNINQAQKWDPLYRKETIDIYKRLSIGSFKGEKKVQLLVWPETAIPFYLQSDERYFPLIYSMVRELSMSLLTGSPAYRETEEGIKYYNSAFLLSPEGRGIGRYDKIHLVPFGEYVPMKRFLPFVNKMVEGVGDFSPGKEITNLSIPEGSFGVLICYEVIFPDLVRRFVKKGADFMVNITNDAWYGRTSAPFQHLSQAVIRSVENRVYLVRAANTGVSAIVNPFGRVIVKSDLFVREVLKGEIRLKKKGYNTFYTRYGNLFAFACVLISVVSILSGWKSKKS